METTESQLGPTDEQFGQLVRYLREIQAVSAEELGERSGLDVATIEELELGRRSAELDELFALAAGLGMRLGMIFRLWELGWVRAS